eukprot:2336136-Rhodomonas_salina.1
MLARNSPVPGTRVPGVASAGCTVRDAKIWGLRAKISALVIMITLSWDRAQHLPLRSNATRVPGFPQRSDTTTTDRIQTVMYEMWCNHVTKSINVAIMLSVLDLAVLVSSTRVVVVVLVPRQAWSLPKLGAFRGVTVSQPSEHTHLPCLGYRDRGTTTSSSSLLPGTRVTRVSGPGSGYPGY